MISDADFRALQRRVQALEVRMGKGNFPNYPSRPGQILEVDSNGVIQWTIPQVIPQKWESEYADEDPTT